MRRLRGCRVRSPLGEIYYDYIIVISPLNAVTQHAVTRIWAESRELNMSDTKLSYPAESSESE